MTNILNELGKIMSTCLRQIQELQCLGKQDTICTISLLGPPQIVQAEGDILEQHLTAQQFSLYCTYSIKCTLMLLLTISDKRAHTYLVSFHLNFYSTKVKMHKEYSMTPYIFIFEPLMPVIKGAIITRALQYILTSIISSATSSLTPLSHMLLLPLVLFFF